MPNGKNSTTTQKKKKTQKAPKREKKVSSSLPGAYASVTRNMNGTTRIHHRELVMAIESGQSFQLAMVPTNSALFPWLSSIASMYDWYIPHSVKFEYVPSCSLTTASGSITFAIDYDCLDSPASNRTQLAQSAGSVTTQIYKGATVSADPTSLRIFPRRYTHSPTSGSDIRLSHMGNLQFISDGDGTIAAGDLFICYDITFGAPSPSSQPSYLFATTSSTHWAAIRKISQTGLFAYNDIGFQGTVGLPYAPKSEDVKVKEAKTFYESQDQMMVEISVPEPGVYSCSVAGIPVNDSAVPTVLPDLRILSESGVTILSSLQSSVQQWTEQTYNFKRSVITFAFEVWDLMRVGHAAIKLVDMALSAFKGYVVAESLANYGLTVARIGGEGLLLTAPPSARSQRARQLGPVLRESVYTLAPLDETQKEPCYQPSPIDEVAALDEEVRVIARKLGLDPELFENLWHWSLVSVKSEGSLSQRFERFKANFAIPPNIVPNKVLKETPWISNERLTDFIFSLGKGGKPATTTTTTTTQDMGCLGCRQ